MTKPAEHFQTFQDRVGAYRALREALKEEWTTAQEMHKSATPNTDEEHYLRRTLVRTLFTCIEGAVQSLKRETLELLRYRNIQLTPAEYATLREETYYLKQQDQAIHSTYSPQTLANIRYTFELHARAWGTTFDFDPPLETNPDWSALHHVQRLRNRLTHPQTIDDLTVTDDDLDYTYAAAQWFFAQRQRLADSTASIWRPTLQALARARASQSSPQEHP